MWTRGQKAHVKKERSKGKQNKGSTLLDFGKYEMRGDKIEVFERLQERLRDYIRDVDIYMSKRNIKILDFISKHHES